jgi:hypothetical protein
MPLHGMALHHGVLLRTDIVVDVYEQPQPVCGILHQGVSRHDTAFPAGNVIFSWPYLDVFSVRGMIEAKLATTS